MRWIPKRTCDGDVRVINKFLIFPKELGGEVRWLECARIKQQCFMTGMAGLPYVWQACGWED